jgi:toxin co-regulated pilus biosynthesis protein E
MFAALLDQISLRYAAAKFRKHESKKLTDWARTWKGADVIGLFTRAMKAYEQRGDKAQARVYANIINRIRRGDGVVSALVSSYAISPTTAMLLRAFEARRDLAEGMRVASAAVASVKAMSSAARKAVLGPSIIFVITLGLTYVFGVSLFPQLSGMLPADKVPLIMQAVIGTARLLDRFVFIALPLLAIALVFWLRSFPNACGPIRKKLDRYLLPYKLYRTQQASNFLLTLGTCLNASMSLQDSLNQIRSEANPWLRSYIDDILDRQRSPARYGIRPSDAGAEFDVGLFDDETLLRVLQLAESSDQLAKAFVTIASEGSEEMVQDFVEKTQVMKSVATVISLSPILVIAGSLSMLMISLVSTTQSLAR